MVDFFITGRQCSFSQAVPCRTFTRRRVRRAVGGRSPLQPYDGRQLGDWLHRLRPPLETISLAGMGIAGGADMAHFFNATRSPRSRAVCRPPPAAPRLAAAARRTRAASGQWQCADRPSAAIRPRRRSAFSAQCPGGPAAAGSAGRVRRGAAQRRWGRFTSKQGPWCWPAAVSPRSAAAGAGGAPRGGGLRPFSAAPPDNQGRGDQAWRNPSAASSTPACATRWPGRRCPASPRPAASS